MHICCCSFCSRCTPDHFTVSCTCRLPRLSRNTQPHTSCLPLIITVVYRSSADNSHLPPPASPCSYPSVLTGKPLPCWEKDSGVQALIVGGGGFSHRHRSHSDSTQVCKRNQLSVGCQRLRCTRRSIWLNVSMCIPACLGFGDSEVISSRERIHLPITAGHV